MVENHVHTGIFGPIRQVAYIVPDLDAAIRAWRNAIGAGPFVVYREVNPFRDLVYRGEPSEDVIISIALGRSGPLQLEFIQQHNDTPSIYTEALANGAGGPHHFAFITPDFDAAYAHAMQIGMEAIAETGAPGSPRMAYLGYSGIPGFIAELLEASEASAKYFDGVDRMLDEADPQALVIEAG